MKPKYVVAAILCLVGAVYLYGWSRERRGLERGRIEASVKAAEDFAKTVAKRDTVYVQKRDTLRRILQRWDSVKVHDTISVEVPGIRDSVIVYVPRAAADTAVKVCLQTLSACDDAKRSRDSLIFGLRAQLKLQQKASPSRLSRILDRGLWLGAGIGIGAVIRR